jgi:regulatory protein
LRSRLLRAAAAQAGEVEGVLDTLQARDLLSEERFVEGFIRSRRDRFGPGRLRHELSRRGVSEERIEAALKQAGCEAEGNEYAAAHALWLKRFKSLPADARAWGRQARFLAGRGFSHDVIRRVLTGR